MAYRNYSVANGFVVDKLGNGDFTTIGAAITAAKSGTTIFIRPGTYVENLTLKQGVDLDAFSGDQEIPTVTIQGKCSYSSAGTVNISNIALVTNADYCLSVTGSVASGINLNSCYVNCTNNTGIQFTSSSASSGIILNYCSTNLGTTGIALYTHSSAGNLGFIYSDMVNSGNSTTASNNSSGFVTIFFCFTGIKFSTTSTGIISIETSSFDTSSLNATPLTLGGTTSTVYFAAISAGSASGISIGGTATISNCIVSSTNTNAVTGAGTLQNGGITFTNTSFKINTSTITAFNLDAGGISFDGGTNVLNIFQQGTFSPTVRGASTAGTVTMTLQDGRYQKVGRIVTVTIAASWSTIGGATGGVQVNNLPYTVLSDSNTANSSPIIPSASPIALTTNAVGFLQTNSNSTNATMVYYVGASSTTGIVTTITASNGFFTTFTYETV